MRFIRGRLVKCLMCGNPNRQRLERRLDIKPHDFWVSVTNHGLHGADAASFSHQLPVDRLLIKTDSKEIAIHWQAHIAHGSNNEIRFVEAN